MSAPSPGEFCETHFSWLCQAGQGECPDPVSRVQAIEAAEDHAEQVAFDAWRERDAS